MAVLENLFVRLGYDVDQEKIDDFNEGVERTARGMKGVVLGALAAATAIATVANKLGQFLKTTDQSAKSIGISEDKMRAWADAFAIITGEGSDANKILGETASIIDNIKFGKVTEDQQRFLNELGLTADELARLGKVEGTLQIVERFQALDEAARRSAATLSNVGDLLLRIGPANLRAVVAEVTTDLDEGPLKKFAENVTRIWQLLRDSVIGIINPMVAAINTAFSDFGPVAIENLDFFFVKVDEIVDKIIAKFKELTDFIDIDARIETAQNFVGGIADSGIEAAGLAFDSFKDTFGFGSDPAELSNRGAGSSTTNTSSQNVSITVSGAGNPQQTAEVIEKTLTRKAAEAKGNLTRNNKS